MPLEQRPVTWKQEKIAPPPPTMRDQHFDLFWATVTRKTIKEMVSHIRRKGWYGKGDTYPVQHALHKVMDDCNTLFDVPVKVTGIKCKLNTARAFLTPSQPWSLFQFT
jgi:hypothetical protein